MAIRLWFSAAGHGFAAEEGSEQERNLHQAGYTSLIDPAKAAAEKAAADKAAADKAAKEKADADAKAAAEKAAADKAAAEVK